MLEEAEQIAEQKVQMLIKRDRMGNHENNEENDFTKLTFQHMIKTRQRLMDTYPILGSTDGSRVHKIIEHLEDEVEIFKKVLNNPNPIQYTVLNNLSLNVNIDHKIELNERSALIAENNV